MTSAPSLLPPSIFKSKMGANSCLHHPHRNNVGWNSRHGDSFHDPTRPSGCNLHWQPDTHICQHLSPSQQPATRPPCTSSDWCAHKGVSASILNAALATMTCPHPSQHPCHATQRLATQRQPLFRDLKQKYINLLNYFRCMNICVNQHASS